MSFRLVSIQTRIVEHPLLPSRIIRSGAGVHDASCYLVVVVQDSQGAFGYGEAATTPIWSGESAQTARFFIEEVFAPLVLGNSFEHPREVAALLDGATYGNPFGKGALDTAIWDVWARSRNKPAWELFADREPVASIPTRASVGCYDVPDTVRIATEFWNAGIKTLKFKIGVPHFDDKARLRAVRQALGPEPVFTVDANGAYPTWPQAVAALEELLPFGLALVEQPTPRERIQAMAQVRRRLEVPILADEAIFNRQELQEALDCEACDYVSLYPGKNGGVTPLLEMAALAAEAGKACAIGSNLETDLGQAAMATLAAGLTAFPVEELACDLSAALFYQASSITEPLKLENGRVGIPTGSGFGVTPVGFG